MAIPWNFKGTPTSNIFSTGVVLPKHLACTMYFSSGVGTEVGTDFEVHAVQFNLCNMLAE